MVYVELVWTARNQLCLELGEVCCRLHVNNKEDIIPPVGRIFNRFHQEVQCREVLLRIVVLSQI